MKLNLWMKLKTALRTRDNMFSFFNSYFAAIKTGILAALAIIISILSMNYVRRGNKIEEQAKKIKGLGVKNDITAINQKVDQELSQKEQALEKKDDAGLLDDINHLHK